MTAAILKSGPERAPQKEQPVQGRHSRDQKGIAVSLIQNASRRSLHSAAPCALLSRASPLGDIKPKYGSAKQRLSQQTVRRYQRAGNFTWDPLTVNSTQQGAHEHQASRCSQGYDVSYTEQLVLSGIWLMLLGPRYCQNTVLQANPVRAQGS